MNDSAIPELSGLRRASLVAGALGVLASLVGAWIDPAQFFRSYLVAFLYVAGLSIGCLGVLMVYHLTGGGWGVAIRRPLEAGAGVLPLVALLFVPLLFGLPSLYTWTQAATMAADEVVRSKQAYLNVPFFLVRAAVYFAAWLVMAFFLARWSRAQDRTGDPRYADLMRKLSGGGIVLLGFTATFASFDWVMSLDVAVAYLLARQAEFGRGLAPTILNDLGNLMLAFVMIWAYLAFSQLLIIWAGNLPEEIPWYLRRISGGWNLIAIGLAVFYFAVPFLVLLSRGNKRRHRRLAAIATGILIVRAFDLFFLVAPEFSPERITAHWLDVATLAGAGGLWLTMFVRQLGTQPLLAPNDPDLAGALARKH